MPIDLNTIITICSFLVSLGIQVGVLAYYAGRFSEMVRQLEGDLKAHKQESMEKHSSLQNKLEAIEREKQIEHSKFNERLGVHDKILENIDKNFADMKETNEKYFSEMKESIKELSNDLRSSRKK